MPSVSDWEKGVNMAIDPRDGTMRPRRQFPLSGCCSDCERMARKQRDNERMAERASMSTSTVDPRYDPLTSKDIRDSIDKIRKEKLIARDEARAAEKRQKILNIKAEYEQYKYKEPRQILKPRGYGKSIYFNEWGDMTDKFMQEYGAVWNLAGTDKLSKFNGTKPKGKKKMMGNIVDKIQQLALSNDEKLLRKYELKDENGVWTDEAVTVLDQIMLEERKADLVAKVKELDAEEKKAKK